MCKGKSTVEVRTHAGRPHMLSDFIFGLARVMGVQAVDFVMKSVGYGEVVAGSLVSPQKTFLVEIQNRVHRWQFESG